MAMTQFAMVEELASLIKDNLYSKHLILSTEEALINFLRVNASVEGILELEPTSPYHRLLLHRLADIYGFAHESVGEGDDRHLVLQRCPETAIPSVLVSDMLWQYDDDTESPTSSLQMLRREDDFVVKPMQSLSLSTRLEERETAYREARNRIFALHDGEEKDDVPKTRKVPVVARRMIAHALGQRIPSPDDKFSSTKFEEHAAGDGNEQSASPSGKSSSRDIKLSHKPSSGGSTSRDGAGALEKGSGDTPKSSKSKSNSIGNESNGGRAVGAEGMQREQIGAAKRIFAHALGLPSGASASTAKVVDERDRALRRET